MFTHKNIAQSVIFAENLDDQERIETREEFIENQIVIVICSDDNNGKEQVKSDELHHLNVTTIMVKDLSTVIDEAIFTVPPSKVCSGVVYMYQKLLDDGTYYVGRVNSRNMNIKKQFKIIDRKQRKNFIPDSDTMTKFVKLVEKKRTSQKYYIEKDKVIQRVEQNYKNERN